MTVSRRRRASLRSELREVMRLDEELAKTTAEMERLAEEQRFALELLEERHGALPPAP